MAINNYISYIIPDKFKRKIEELTVYFFTRHIWGEKSIRLSEDEAVVTCVVKNGEYYLKNFINHYQKLGFRHIFLLDNGSTDSTSEIAKKYKNVSIYQCKLPIDKYQKIYKHYLARKTCHGGWCLDTDIDEFFDYPFSKKIQLNQFLGYLNKMGYTTVLTQLLDMIPDRPLTQLFDTKQDDLSLVYQYFDLSNISKIPYSTDKFSIDFGNKNLIPSNGCKLLYGGIRKTLYNNNCLLTKHSLFFPSKVGELFPHVHFVNQAKIADVSCPILHYKITSNALKTALQNREVFIGNSKGYDDFITFLFNKSEQKITQDTSVKYQSAEDLYKHEFIFISDQYLAYKDSIHQN